MRVLKSKSGADGWVYALELVQDKGLTHCLFHEAYPVEIKIVDSKELIKSYNPVTGYPVTVLAKLMLGFSKLAGASDEALAALNAAVAGESPTIPKTVATEDVPWITGRAAPVAAEVDPVPVVRTKRYRRPPNKPHYRPGRDVNHDSFRQLVRGKLMRGESQERIYKAMLKKFGPELCPPKKLYEIRRLWVQLEAEGMNPPPYKKV